MEQRESLHDEISLLDLFIVLLKRKKLIAGITLAVAIITTVISLILPPIFKAETKILPPQQHQTGVASQLMREIGGLTPIKTPNELFVKLVESRPVLDRVIDRFDLMKLYKSKLREDARIKLAQAIEARDDKKSGIITIAVEDTDPKRAAEIANALVEELKNLNNTLALTEASQKRLFFEEQLKLAKEELIKAEETLKEFQEKTGAITIEEQAKAVLESIANLRAQIAAKEVQLKVMKTYATAQNPDLQRAEEELKGLKEQLAKLERKGSGHNPDVLMPAGRMPEVGTEYIRKLREFKFNEAHYEILLKQYETARLDEAKDATIIQVIEKAIPPEKKAKPKRIIMVLVATTTAFFFAIFLAFFIEYKEKISHNPENKEKIEALKRYAEVRLPFINKK